MVIYVILGTGGTISGVGRFLKTMAQGLKIILADPEGSGLYNKVGISRPFLGIEIIIRIGKIRCHVRSERGGRDKTKASGK